MKRIALAGALLAVAMPSAAAFYSGNEMRRGARAFLAHTPADTAEGLLSTQFLIYSMGVYDGFESSGMKGKHFCSPSSVTGGQIATIVARYLDAHPEQWHEAASDLTLGALVAAFPCAKKKY